MTLTLYIYGPAMREGARLRPEMWGRHHSWIPMKETPQAARHLGGRGIEPPLQDKLCYRITFSTFGLAESTKAAILVNWKMGTWRYYGSLVVGENKCTDGDGREGVRCLVEDAD